MSFAGAYWALVRQGELGVGILLPMGLFEFILEEADNTSPGGQWNSEPPDSSHYMCSQILFSFKLLFSASRLSPCLTLLNTIFIYLFIYLEGGLLSSSKNGRMLSSKQPLEILQRVFFILKKISILQIAGSLFCTAGTP